LKIKFIYYFIIFIGFVNCTSRKKINYFQGALSDREIIKSYNPKLKCGDVISIMVMSLDDIAIKPFNLPVQNISQTIGGYTQGTPSLPGYLIDEKGNIDFPNVGKIKLEGITRTAAVDTLKSVLKPFLNNPTILIRILNYKITVLGDVRNPGTFSIPNERITLIEALGIAGDLNITGKRNNILVIRENEGKRTETLIDLTSKDFFSSPVYYLQQNDIVYVEPNRAKRNTAAINTTNISLIVSVVSLLITLGVLLTK
jgi:polysaccharide export outer membrane protein